MQRTLVGLSKIWLVGGSFSQCMGEYGGRDSQEKDKGSMGEELPRKKKIPYVVEGTPVMPLPTRANPVLCCNRIKIKHGLPTSSPVHLFPIRGKRKREPGTLQIRDQNLPK